MNTVDAVTASVDDRAFFGHPKGLFYLAFTEAWERFSFYGMTALLVLYMVNQLLLPGHVEHIAGFAAFRSVLESFTGPLSTLAIASLIFGLYSGFVYFTPVFGGLIADRWIGQRSAVVIGALSMSAGHIAMAFDQTFLLALLLLVVGALIAVIVITIFQSTSYYQLYNVFKIWIQDHVDLSVGSFSIPVPWYQSLDALVSILVVPVLFVLWRWQASRRGEPRELAKIGIGAWLAACSHLILVAAIFFARGELVHPIWPALCAAGSVVFTKG